MICDDEILKTGYDLMTGYAWHNLGGILPS